MQPRPRLVLLGKQGAGKGTQAVRISEHYDVAHFSTGDLFRELARLETEFGLKAKKYMDAGELVPDETVIGVVQRDDDTEEAVERRLLAYERDTVPIIDYYREIGKRVRVVDGVGTGDVV